MPSRLKGIETSRWNHCSPFWFEVWMCLPVWRELKRNRGMTPSNDGLFVWMCLPVWRELKLDGVRRLVRPRTSLDVPSCLKGIETLNHADAWPAPLPRFGCAFPFEGNWNVNPKSILPYLSLPIRSGFKATWQGRWKCFNALKFLEPVKRRELPESRRKSRRMEDAKFNAKAQRRN